MAMRKTVVSTKLHGVMTKFEDHNRVGCVDKLKDIVKKGLELSTNNKIDEELLKPKRHAEDRGEIRSRENSKNFWWD